MNQELQQAFGNLAVRKIQLEAQETQLKQQFATNSQKETEFAQKIESKYGRGSVDVQKGVFIPSRTIMSDKIKFTDEEMDSLRDLQTSYTEKQVN